jgi:hypothetical protein
MSQDSQPQPQPDQLMRSASSESVNMSGMQDLTTKPDTSASSHPAGTFVESEHDEKYDTSASSHAAGTFVESEHDKKYDRQMRLWGAHGQRLLQTAHVCVLHSGPASSEALKNLVLPCVGSFTLVDDAVVTPADCGNNFFVDVEHMGMSRAETVTELLLEMNPEVRGTAVVRAPADVIANDVDFFARFTLVIAVRVVSSRLVVCNHCFEGLERLFFPPLFRWRCLRPLPRAHTHLFQSYVQ